MPRFAKTKFFIKQYFRQIILAIILFVILLGLIFLTTVVSLTNIAHINSFPWFLILARILLAIIAALALWEILKRLKKDENEPNDLSLKLDEEVEGNQTLINKLKQQGVETPLSGLELHAENRLALSISHPHVLDYIKEARKIGLDDGTIRQELAKAGWDAEEINQAFK